MVRVVPIHRWRATMIEFFEENLGSITLLLAIGTFWMALSTRASASASKKIFELEARPCLVFNKPMFRLHQEAMRVDENKPHINKELTLGIEFKNPSRVPLRYSITSIRMTFDSRTVDNPTFNTSGALIYPGDFGVFWFGTLPYHEQLNVAKQGVIEYTVKYEAIDHKRGFINFTGYSTERSLQTFLKRFKSTPRPKPPMIGA